MRTEERQYHKRLLVAATTETPLGSLVAVVDSDMDGALVRLDFAHPDDAIGVDT